MSIKLREGGGDPSCQVSYELSIIYALSCIHVL